MTTYTSAGKNLYLLRGIPGAGKSTLAKQLGCTHFETWIHLTLLFPTHLHKSGK